jgi:predicted GH43/DUF377 family glycosyl hydrolase
MFPRAQSFVERNRWYSLYSYRTVHRRFCRGLRLAISTDGHALEEKSPGPDLLVAAPESQYIEWHQIYKIGKRYVMLYEGYNGGKRWGADIAFSDRLTSGWKKAPIGMIDQTRWENYADQTLFHVATPAILPDSRSLVSLFSGRPCRLLYQAELGTLGSTS